MNCPKCGIVLKEDTRFCPGCGVPVSPGANNEVDHRLAAFERALGQKYRILKKVGAGGFAEVYLGEHTQLGRKVAIKILHANYAVEESMVERFRRESRSAAKLSHPNIIDIYDVGEGEGIYYFVMKYVEGETLARKMSRERQISPREAIYIVKQVADALAYAHANDVIHRDIKPANIMLDQFGKPVLMDFGIARVQFEGNLTKTGTLMGTPHYLPPEQPLGKPVDGRSDIYSLGIVFYEMMAGRPPFHDENSVTLIFKHINEQPPPIAQFVPDILPELSEVVHKMIEKLPEDRYQSATEVVEALDSLAAIYPPPTGGGRKSTPGASRDTEQLLILAKENLQLQKFDKAIEIYATLLKRDPNNPATVGAIQDLENILEERMSQAIDKNEFGEARILFSQLQKIPVPEKRLTSLRAQLEAAEQKAFKETEFISQLEAAKAALMHDNASGAIEKLTKALTIDPNNAEAQELLRRARASYEENRKKAEYVNALSEAEYYYSSKSYEKALAAAKRALEISNDAQTIQLYNKIQAALKEKAYKQSEQERIFQEVDQLCENLEFGTALKMLTQAKADFPALAEARLAVVEKNRALYQQYLLARELFDNRNWQQAVEAFEAFLNTNPPYDFQAFYRLRKDAEEALKTAHREVRMQGQYGERKAVSEVEQQMKKVDVLMRMGQLEQAREECRAILQRTNHPVVQAKLQEIEDRIAPGRTRITERPNLKEDHSRSTIQVPSSMTKMPVIPPSQEEPVRPGTEPEIKMSQTVMSQPMEPAVAQQPYYPQQPVHHYPVEKKPFPVTIIFVLAGLVAVGIIVGLFMMGPEEKKVEDHNRLVSPPAQPLNVPLAVKIDAQPWANIEISGGALTQKINETTPVVVQLPPGRYTVVFTNPQMEMFTEVLDVHDGNTEFTYSFRGMDPERLVEQLTR